MTENKKLAAFAALLMAWPSAAAGQGIPAQDTARRIAHATRIDRGAPNIDGLLDDEAWNSAAVISDFVQKIPLEGGEPSQRTEVRLLYDDAALYVGAKLLHSDPDAIRRSITRRDGESDAEVLTVSLDTYLDRRTAYSFSISSGGVRGDWYLPQDSEDSGRETQYNPVWNAQVQVVEDGWVAEMRIPFSQLRFNAVEAHTWGLQITRQIPELSERVQWVLIPVSAAGFASHFGLLEGISGIPPTRRLELLPYVASEVTTRTGIDPADPFDDRLTGRVGGDLKMGLGPNLTLDATFNPDFGQVEADPAVVNLTAFETVFDERRPFFIEGNELLTGRGQSFLGRPTWFYTRRVGAAPRGGASGDFVKQPSSTTILSAAKVTGRLASGLSIGAMAALTPREFASTYDSVDNRTSRVAVEPPSVFGVFRLQQDVGSQQSNVGASFTTVHRSFQEGDQLGQLLAADAVAGGVDWKLRYREGMYEITGWLGGSRVSGDPSAIARLQRSSAHYFQRPDQDHVSFDASRTSLSGYSASVRADKNAGRYTVAGIQLSTRSPGFEINDAGQMRSGDDIDFNADIQLRDTQPNRFVQFFQFGTSVVAGWDYGRVRQYTRIRQTGRATLHSFWTIRASAERQLRSLSGDLSRGGPLVGTPSGYTLDALVSSRPNEPTVWTARAAYSEDEFGGSSWDIGTGITIRPAARWQASVEPGYSQVVDSRQYVGTLPGGTPATFGERYVFAFVERREVSAQFRLDYALTPDFTIEAYAEPFAATGEFYDFGELPAARARSLRVYGSPGSGTTITQDPAGYNVIDGTQTFALPVQDFSRLSFRSNLVLRWEWLPGSTAFLVWQQNRFDSEDLARGIGPGDLWDAARSDGDNIFVMKVSYWFGLN